MAHRSTAERKLFQAERIWLFFSPHQATLHRPHIDTHNQSVAHTCK